MWCLVPKQVEGLCALVEGVQELVARAEQVTSAEFVRGPLAMHALMQSAACGLPSC